MDLSKLNPNNHVNSTIANQLALYVTMYSPLQMAADLPENYNLFGCFSIHQRRNRLESNLKQSLQYITVARKAKGTNNWFVGNVNGERHVRQTLNLTSWRKEKNNTIYADAKDAHYKTNPQAYVIRKVVVTNKSKLSQLSAPGGGYAVSIIEISN
jgi:hypothetical protein